MSQLSTDILKLRIDELEVSSFFVVHSKKLKFNTLEDIVRTGWGAIQHMEEYDHFWCKELLQFMDKRHLLYLLEH